MAGKSITLAWPLIFVFCCGLICAEAAGAKLAAGKKAAAAPAVPKTAAAPKSAAAAPVLAVNGAVPAAANAVVAPAASAKGAAFTAPPGYELDKRVNKYFKILQEPKDYYSAGKACAADGGRLAVTYGDKYLDVLKDYVKKVTNQDSMWVSGTRLANSSPRILFDDGVTLDSGNQEGGELTQHWAPGEPNNANGLAIQNCMNVYGANSFYAGRWDDNSCSKTFSALCEVVPPAETAYTKEKPKDLPAGYEYDLSSDKFFKFNSEAKTYDEAEKACQLDKGRLAVLYGTSSLSAQGKYALKSTANGYWISGKQLGPENPFWYFADGTALNSRARDSGDYAQNWADGQPDNKAGEECLSVFATGANKASNLGSRWVGGWNDEKCDVKSPYLCEYLAANEVPKETEAIIEPPEVDVNIWGQYDEWLSCPAGQHMVGLRMMVLPAYKKPKQPNQDDVAVNDVDIVCRASVGKRENKRVEGKNERRNPGKGFGTWGAEFNCAGTEKGVYVTGIEPKVLESQKYDDAGDPNGDKTDDMGLTDLRFTCSDKKTVTSPNGVEAGTWRGAMECPSGLRACGISLKSYPKIDDLFKATLDDVMVTTLRLKCCAVPNPPAGYEFDRYSEKFYKLYDVKANQKAAADACKKDGGQLAILYGVNSTNILAKFAMTTKAESFWVDGVRSGATSTWTFSDKKTLDDKARATGEFMQHWADGEPNNVGNKENCIHVFSHPILKRRPELGKSIGRWNDWGCDNEGSYVCEWTIPAVPTVPGVPAG